MGIGRRQPWAALPAALILLTSAPTCQGQEEVHIEDSAVRIEDGHTQTISKCFYLHHAYMPSLPADDSARGLATDYLACQRRCIADQRCAFFTFFNASRECRLAGSDAVYETAEHSADGMAIAGPKICPRYPSGCTEMPGPHFPGYTAKESKLAFRSHRVPKNMECWPVNWTEGVYKSCRTFKVLESTALGWPGKCWGLKQVLLPEQVSCESSCKNKLSCSVFQESQDNPPYGSTKCWHGDGTSGIDCYERRKEPNFPTPLSAKRFMRGEVRVLAKLKGIEVKGLFNAFPETYFIHISDAAKACRDHCYSNVFCQYWQYYLESGCWVEDPVQANGVKVAFPPTTLTWLVGSQQSKTAVDGEYIQHVCFDGGKVGRKMRHEWTLISSNVLCKLDALKRLANARGNLMACMTHVLEDPDCGNKMYTDSRDCWCILKSKTCNPRHGEGGLSIYSHKAVREVGKLDRYAMTQRDQAEAHGYHHVVRATTTRAPFRLFQAGLTVGGMHFASIEQGQQAVLMGRYVSVIAAALGVPSSYLKDTTNIPGRLYIRQGATPDETKVGFILSAPASTEIGTVSGILENESFAQEFTNVSLEVVPAAANGSVVLRHVSVREVGGQLPRYHPEQETGGDSRAGPAPEERGREFSARLPGWVWAMVAPISLCLLGLTYCCKDAVQMQAAGASAEQWLCCLDEDLDSISNGSCTDPDEESPKGRGVGKP